MAAEIPSGGAMTRRPRTGGAWRLLCAAGALVSPLLVGRAAVQGDGPLAAAGGGPCPSGAVVEARASSSSAATPRVRVNQLGFLVDGRKLATLLSADPQPQPWILHDSSWNVLAQGMTEPRGEVHVIDFSSVRRPGARYRIQVLGEESDPFAIGDRVYRPLVRDALAFFYHQRSGAPIATPYVSPERARDAGHLSDASLTCLKGCAGTADLSGGWYDAGDTGKYVVTGGVSAWTLLDLYERLAGSDTDAARDGGLSIPESSDRVPDLLDEARWEIEWMLRMQVAEGEALSGMVRHSVHDDSWSTQLLGPPAPTVAARHAEAPSTAATLQLAAVGARCGRVYASIDRAFARRCRAAAERAWRAAAAHPAVLPAEAIGGGTYGDESLGDEVFWAAAELLRTTEEARYREVVWRDPRFGASAPVPDEGYGGLDWSDTALLGVLALARAPDRARLDEERAAAQRVLRALAARLADLSERHAYGWNIAPGPKGDEPYWGSNSAVVNNALVLATAYDLTGEPRLRDAVADAMGYLLGRNPVGISYVTGYGSRTVQRPHHRFWAWDQDPSLPRPPAGVLVGGPNSYVQDPEMQSRMRGCAGLECYLDDFGAYSVNEVAVNWNAPLAWVAGWLDLQGLRAAKGPRR